MDAAIYRVSAASSSGENGSGGPAGAKTDEKGPEMEDLLKLQEAETGGHAAGAGEGADQGKSTPAHGDEGDPGTEAFSNRDNGNGDEEYGEGEGEGGQNGSEEDENDTDPDERWRKTFSPVKESAAVDLSYFDDALFIGDSRVMGLMLYSGLTKATFYTEKGVSVSNLMKNPMVMRTGGAKITIPEALKQRQFGKIYVKAGINELGWRNIGMFDKAYGDIVDQIRELQPDAVVYVQSILPAAKSKAQKDSSFSIERITEFNEHIQKMTWEKGVHYLDVFQFMADDEGYLPENAGSDGVHLNKEYCVKWLEFLQCHTVRGEYAPYAAGFINKGEDNE